MKHVVLLLSLIVISGCSTKKSITQDPIPKHETLKIQSKYVQEERVINVYTPPNYDRSSKKFPVVYMLDGGIKEDFPHIANTLDTLIKQGKIPPCLLVGIENTIRKRDLTGPTTVEYDLKYIPNAGGSDNFRKFIKEELFPKINNKYRTTAERTIIGESLAGLFVVETCILDPEMFQNYIAMDPSLWFNEQYLVKEFASLVQKNSYQDKKLWFAGSGATDINQHTNTLSMKIKENLKSLTHKYLSKPEEKHSTIFRATKEEAFIWTLAQ